MFHSEYQTSDWQAGFQINPRPLPMLHSHQKKSFCLLCNECWHLKMKKWEKRYFLTTNMFYCTEKCQWTLLAIEVLFIYHWNCVMIFFAMIHLTVLEYWHLKSVYLLKLKRRAHFLPLSCQGIYNVTNLQSNLVDRKSLQSNYDASMN